jgi:DNA-binding CsgD family transcriptional regulator
MSKQTTAFLSGEAWSGIVHSLGLSRREAEIVALLLSDDSRDESIAEQLAISRHTVHTYLERLYRKVGASSRSQVVTRIFQQYVALEHSNPRSSARARVG